MVGASTPAQSRARQSSGTDVRHVWFLTAEVLLLLLLGAMSWIARAHPGPLTGDVRIETGVQSALLPHHAVASALYALSTINWPVPTAITLTCIIGLFLLLRRWLDAIVTPLVALVSSVVTFELSKWVHRPRPWGYGVHPLQHITTTFSFPSGHVTYTVAVFGLFLYLTYQVRRAVHRGVLWSVRVLLIVVIVLMPVSRVLEAEHWPSDTLAGGLNGLFWCVLFAHLYSWSRARWPGLLAPDER